MTDEDDYDYELQYKLCHEIELSEEEQKEQEWMREAYNWQSLSGSEKYFDVEAEDGFYYALDVRSHIELA